MIDKSLASILFASASLGGGCFDAVYQQIVRNMQKKINNLIKGFWKENKKPEKVIKSKSKRRRVTSKSKKELSDKFFKSISSEVVKNGYRSIRVSTMMKKLKIGRRTENSVENLNEEFKRFYRYSAGMLDGCKSDRCRQLMN